MDKHNTLPQTTIQTPQLGPRQGKQGDLDPAPSNSPSALRYGDSHTIAKAWLQAIARTTANKDTYNEGEAQKLLKQLVEQAYLLLFDPDTPAASVQIIGRALANLHYTEPEALSKTVEVLGGRLLAHLPEHEAFTLQPRLLWLLGQIALGFHRAVYSEATQQQENLGNEPLHQITGHDHIDSILKQYSDRLRALHEIELAILNEQSLESIADVAVKRLKEMLPCQSVVLLLIELEIGRAQVLSSDFPNFAAGRQLKMTDWQVISALMQGDIHRIDDTHELTERSPVAKELQEKGSVIDPVVNFPLRIRDKLIGVISLSVSKDQEYTEQQIEIGREIADTTAIAIHNARLLAAMSVASDRGNTLRYVAGSLTANLELNTLLRLVLERLSTVMQSVSSRVLLFDGNDLKLVANHGLQQSESLLKGVQEVGFPNVRRVINNRHWSIIKDTTLDPQWIPLPEVKHFLCWLCVPLLVRDKILGALVLEHDEPNFYTEEDAEFVQTFADQVAIAIENARLFQQVQEQTEKLEERVRERTRKLEALYKVSAIASAYIDLPAILQHSLEQVLQTLDCNAGMIYTLNEETGRLELTAHNGLDTVPEVEEGLGMLPIGHPLLGMLFDYGEPTEIPPILQQATVTGYICEQCQDSAVALIRARGRFQGILIVFSANDDAITVEAITLLEAIADQIGVAIENSHLRQQARQLAIIEERERLAQELHDSVTQGLYSLSLFAEAVRETAANNDMVTVRRYALSIINTAQQSLREMRLLLYELRARTPLKGGLVEALRERIRTVEERVNVSVKMRANTLGELPATIEEAYYRVALEALNNAMRHANAEKVEIQIRRQENQLSMVVEDDGNGFHVEVGIQSGGMGLDSMQRRIAQIGGDIAFDSHPGQGTKVTVTTLLPDS